MDLFIGMLEEAPFVVSKLQVVDDTIMFYGTATVHDVLVFWYALNCHVAYGGQVRYASMMGLWLGLRYGTDVCQVHNLYKVNICFLSYIHKIEGKQYQPSKNGNR